MAGAVPQTSGTPASGSSERLIDQVSRLVLKRAQEDRLLTPAMPSTMAKCLEMVRAPDFEFGAMVELLEKEPMVAAALLRLANSSAYAGRGATTSVRSALTRLGVKEVMRLIVEVSAERIFVSRDVGIAGAAAMVWKHSVAVGIATRDLRSLQGHTDGDDGYLAGLIHDIGKPIVAGILFDAERQIVEMRSQKWITAAQWQLVVERTHRAAGIALAEKWGLPPVVVTAIRECTDFDPSDRDSLANAVCFCNALAKLGGVATQSDNLEDARALLMIGKSMLGIEDALAEKIQNSLAARVSTLTFR